MAPAMCRFLFLTFFFFFLIIFSRINKRWKCAKAVNNMMLSIAQKKKKKCPAVHLSMVSLLLHHRNCTAGVRSLLLIKRNVTIERTQNVGQLRLPAGQMFNYFYSSSVVCCYHLLSSSEKLFLFLVHEECVDSTWDNSRQATF